MLATILLASCAKTFYTQDAYTLAHSQKTIAIILPTISIPTNKKIDAELMKEQQKTESANFQKEMYSWMLKQKKKGKISQEIQEIETTNAKLIKAGYPENPLITAELCEVLGVDGIMTSNYSLSKQTSDGFGVGMALLIGFWDATNEVNVCLSISDCENKKLIWNYDHKFLGRMGHNPSRLVEGLMRQASKKMPYVN